MEIIAELVRRGAIVALWLRVFLQVLLGLKPAERVHTRAYQAPRSPARPWALEARTVRKVGRRVVAVRLQLIAVAV